MLKLTVNGKTRELDQPQTLMSFLSGYGIDLNFVAVGYNGEVLDKEEYLGVVLKEGDVLEIVRPVGGGQLLLPLVVSPSNHDPVAHPSTSSG